MKRICEKCGIEFDGEPWSLKCSTCADESKRDKIRVRTCRECGTQFMGGPRAWYCPDCRIKRQREAELKYLARKKAGHNRKLGDEYPCEVCGKPYIYVGGMQKYCPDCADAAYAEVKSRITRAWLAAHRNPDDVRRRRQATTAPIACVICGKSFVPDTRAFTCSPECSAELERRTSSEYWKEHPEGSRAKNARQRAKLLTLPAEEQEKRRLERNAREREYYRKHKEREKQI
jgi:hypothetical protein